MIPADLNNRLWYRMVVLFAALVLGGCYTSQAPLISPVNADYPFQSMTFYSVAEVENEAEAEMITLARRGDVYVELSKEDEEKYLFAKINDDLYIAQISGINDEGKIEIIYGIVQLRNDTDMVVLSPTCDHVSDDLLETVGIVKTDKQFVSECMVSSLDQLKALAGLIVGTDIKREAYKIVELVR